MDNIDVTEVLKHVGGINQNNLNEILKNFDDSEDEINTFGYSPYIELKDINTDSIKDKFSILSLNIQSVFAPGLSKSETPAECLLSNLEYIPVVVRILRVLTGGHHGA